MTGWDLETGPNGMITGGSWTCPWCDTILETVSYIQTAMHKQYECDRYENRKRGQRTFDEV